MTGSPFEQIELELFARYKELSMTGVDLHDYRIQSLRAIYNSLDSKRSKGYRAIRGAVVGAVPVVGGASHTILTGRSHAKKCVEAYGLAGRHGNKEIVKEVVEEILLGMGVGFAAEQVVGSAVPGVGSVMAAISAPKVMEKVLEVVHNRADELHINAIRLVNMSNMTPQTQFKPLYVYNQV